MEQPAFSFLMSSCLTFVPNGQKAVAGLPNDQNLPHSIASGYLELPERQQSGLSPMSIPNLGRAVQPETRGKHLDQHSMPKSLKQVTAAYQLIGCECRWKQPADSVLWQSLMQWDGYRQPGSSRV
jgi:hypothetical protein